VLPAPIEFTMKTAGTAWLAGSGDAATVPDVHVKLICTEAPLTGENTLFTVNVAVPGATMFWMLVIVQFALPPAARGTLAQAAWMAV